VSTVAEPAAEVAGVPVRSWSDHLAGLDWRQGEHVALVGPTGQGKTTLALQLLDRRRYRVIIATKPKDRTLDGLRRRGWLRLTSWPPPNDIADSVILWPPWRTPADTAKQKRVIADALHRIFASGSWCVFADDVQYLTTTLGLRPLLQMLWLQARSLGISVVAATQRPRNVPVEMWSQSSHLYIWRCSDAEDLRRIAGLGSHDSTTIRRVVATLPEFHVLYVDARRGGTMHVTRVEVPK